MNDKLKYFYHKYDYKINANFVLETIINTFVFILIGILFFLLGYKEVKADSVIVTPVKPNIQIVLNNSLQSSYPGVSKNLNNINTWTYKNSFIAGDYSFSGVSFNYTNANLCPGNDITIQGTIQSSGNSYLSQFLRLGTAHIFMDSNTSHSECSFRISDNYNDLIDFTCTGQGGGNISIYYQGPPYQPNPGSENSIQTIFLGISQQFNVTCNKSNADIGQDIINNNNNNTQIIINNQNDNANKIDDSIKDVNDSLTDSNVDSDSISSLTTTELPGNGVLSNILNMPISFFQKLLNQFKSTSCNPIVFTLPFVHQNVSIPCPRDLFKSMGALVFYESIGTLVGGIALFKYLIYMGRQFHEMEKLSSQGISEVEFGGL